jgi:hypothetical protein
VHQERVLVLPFIIALPADNPMQSELACHIGMKGKFFCWICTVGGNDKEPEAQDADENRHPDNESEGGSASETEQPKRGKKRLETMAEMIDRVRRFTRVRAFSFFSG